ncbi:MAG TPA: hypothetical protein ENO27_03050 [Caldithrix sp.]|nr:hypothetical protein [Caldithrix sp.]
MVRHSNWNENSTTPDNLSYVKDNSDYHKIPDGNATGNGSHGFYAMDRIKPQDNFINSKIAGFRDLAIETANIYNDKDNQYNNPAIVGGGLDFSDVSETCWIFGFDQWVDAGKFFEEFSKSSES